MLEDVAGLLLDLDGWSIGVLPGAAAFIEYLHQSGQHFLALTEHAGLHKVNRMKDIRVVNMRPRHVADASRFIAEVLGEQRRVTVRDLEEFLDWDDDEVLLLVAETGSGDFAGVAAVVYERWNDTGNIEWIGLVEGLRGRGTGSSMLHRLIDWTRSQGGRKIYVDTGVDSEKAIAFYERNGFAQEAVLKDWYYDGGDAVLLSRRTAD